ncbi:Uncharacterised protein [Mycobacteroides abscessus subsp. abscessus]|nr:Uncharacterised protein [Mycobacteroides abscessus subsp. abscessus]
MEPTLRVSAPLIPIAPTQSITALRDASNSTSATRPCRISASTFTGLWVEPI